MPSALNASKFGLAWAAIAGLTGCPAASSEAEEPTRARAASATAARRLGPPEAPAILHLGAAASPPPAASAPAPASSAEATPAAPRVCRVAAVGDSLTDHRSGGGGYLRVLEKRCPKSEFVNYGKGGDMVNQMRRRFEAEVLAQPPSRFTHLIVFGGVNDLYSDETAKRTPEKIERDLTAMYRAARERGWRVLAFTVAPWGGFGRWYTAHRAATTRELNGWIRSLPALGEVQAVVDAHALLSCGDPDKLCADFEKPFRDGLHFGSKGHEVLGQALYEAEFGRCL